MAKEVKEAEEELDLVEPTTWDKLVPDLIASINRAIHNHNKARKERAEKKAREKAEKEKIERELEEKYRKEREIARKEEEKKYRRCEENLTFLNELIKQEPLSSLLRIKEWYSNSRKNIWYEDYIYLHLTDRICLRQNGVYTWREESPGSDYIVHIKATPSDLLYDFPHDKEEVMRLLKEKIDAYAQ